MLGPGPINPPVTYIPATGLFEVTGGLIGPGPSIESIVTELTSQTLPLLGQYSYAYQALKIAGVTDGQSSGTKKWFPYSCGILNLRLKQDNLCTMDKMAEILSPCPLFGGSTVLFVY